jgi:chromosome partitioning protein
LTALDSLNETTLGSKPNLSHLTARQEVRRLIEQLKLPIDERGRRRAAARAEWLAAQNRPLDTDDLIVEEPATAIRAIAPGGRDATL